MSHSYPESLLGCQVVRCLVNRVDYHKHVVDPQAQNQERQNSMHIRKLIPKNKGDAVARCNRDSNAEKTHHGRYDPHVYGTAAPKDEKTVDVNQKERYEHESDFRPELPQKVGFPDLTIEWSDIDVLARLPKFVNLVEEPRDILPLHELVCESLGKVLLLQIYLKTGCFGDREVIVAEDVVLLGYGWRCATEHELNIDDLSQLRISSLITFPCLYFLD